MRTDQWIWQNGAPWCLGDHNKNCKDKRLTMVSSTRANVGSRMDPGDKTYEDSEDFHVIEVFSNKVVWDVLRHCFKVKN